jgi:hypothetical protein
MLKITYKVPNGKLLKLKIKLDQEKRVTFFELRGDFFMYPEDGFLEIEKFMLGNKLDDKLFSKLNVFITDSEFEIFGFSADSLKEAIYTCLEKK